MKIEVKKENGLTNIKLTYAPDKRPAEVQLTYHDVRRLQDFLKTLETISDLELKMELPG